jgi:hypothetical protein
MACIDATAMSFDVAKVVDFAEAAAAFERLQGAKHLGKLVIGIS